MRIIIAGGGNVGVFVARGLAEAGHDVIIVERDPDRVAKATMNDEPPGVAWMAADACEVSEMVRARPEDADVVCAVTGDDEDNLVISWLAKEEFEVRRVVARVNNPDNEWLFDEAWGVDVAVSTPHLLTALVEEAVSVGSLVRLLTIAGGQARLVEVTLADDSPAAGRPLASIGLPDGARVVALVRGAKVLVPHGDTELRATDEVVVLVADGSEDELRARLVG